MFFFFDKKNAGLSCSKRHCSVKKKGGSCQKSFIFDHYHRIASTIVLGKRIALKDCFSILSKTESAKEDVLYRYIQYFMLPSL